MWRVRKTEKKDKLLQYAERVWNLTEGSDDEKVDLAIARTEEFFHSLGIKTRLSDHDIDEAGIERIVKALEKHGMVALSEHGNITPAVSREILKAAL